MALEMVLLAPLLIMFIMVVVFFGRYVSVRGDVEAASRDAVRAASFERDDGSAADAAQQAAEAAVGGKWVCEQTDRSGDFAPGEVITVTLSCEIPLKSLGLIGLSGSKTFTATSQAPLDLYRRVGDGGTP